MLVARDHDVSKEEEQRLFSSSSKDFIHKYKHDNSLPDIVLRSILSKIKKNEMRFIETPSNQVTLAQVQALLNKLSTSNTDFVQEKLIKFCTDNKNLKIVISLFIQTASKQPLFTAQFAEILLVLIRKFPHYNHVIGAILQKAVSHLFIRRDIYVDTSSIQPSAYLQYCRANAIKNKCNGFFSFISYLLQSNEIHALNCNFAQAAFHTLIQSIHDARDSNCSTLVESIISLMQYVQDVPYLQELYHLTQTSEIIDVRSKFILLNAIDHYQTKKKRGSLRN